MRNSGRGWVTAEYGMLPRATLTRTPRESERGKIGGRTHEIQRLIGRSLRSVVDMQALGERTVILDCDVLQADGGTRTAAITGAAVALALALNKLVAAGTLKTSPLKQLVAATSVGIVDGTRCSTLLRGGLQAEVDMNVVMLEDGGLVETQATAERDPYTRAQFEQMLDLAEKGIQELFAAPAIHPRRRALGRQSHTCVIRPAASSRSGPLSFSSPPPLRIHRNQRLSWVRRYFLDGLQPLRNNDPTFKADRSRDPNIGP